MPGMRMGHLGSKNLKEQGRGKKKCADQGRMPEGATLVKFEGTIPDYIRGSDLTHPLKWIKEEEKARVRGRLEGDVFLALKMEEGSLEAGRGEEAHGPGACTEHIYLRARLYHSITEKSSLTCLCPGLAGWLMYYPAVGGTERQTLNLKGF